MSHAGRPPTDDELQLLPPLIRCVAQAAGVAPALAFAARHGGQIIYVPKTASAEHPLAADIGLAGLQALCDLREGQGGLVSVPKALRAVLAVRNQRMRRERSEASIRDLARAYRLDRRRVQQIMAEACGQLQEDEPDLFS